MSASGRRRSVCVFGRSPGGKEDFAGDTKLNKIKILFNLGEGKTPICPVWGLLDGLHAGGASVPICTVLIPRTYL